MEGQRDEGTGPVTATDYPACWTWPLPDEPVATLEAAYEWQDDRCAVCGSTKRRMVEDHDHETSWCRGKLCRSCNALEGHAGLDSLRFERYRLVNPASIFGVEEAYVDMFGREAKPDPWPTPEEFIASLPASVWTTKLEDLDDRPISALELYGLGHLLYKQPGGGS